MHTGVFPCAEDNATTSLPRAYGGVSSIGLQQKRLPTSSPCIRGCFFSIHNINLVSKVFPVHTGVFLWGHLPEGA